jgi:exosortase/archaeosortase family protein
VTPTVSTPPVPAASVDTRLRRRRPFTVSDHDRIVARRARTVAIFLAAVVLAYHYSLSTLLRTARGDTPLAYLGLVPLLALGLAWLRSRLEPQPPATRDRRLDYLVGLPPLLVALGLNLLLPARLGVLFWIWRLDLLTLPLFVAGVVALLFGAPALWRARVPIAFLLLAWPLPYTSFLTNQLQTFTDLTVGAVRLVLHVFPVAHPIGSSDGTLFAVVHDGRTFPVSVASACSGVNGVVGYTLVALAFLGVVRGPARRKLAWLTAGLVVIWSLNVARIVIVFAAAMMFGKQVAFDGFHPFLGLLTFAAGVVAMLALLRRFGLDVPTRRPPSAPTGDGSAPRPSPGPVRPRTGLAVVLVVGAALLCGIVNTQLRSYDTVADAVGTPRLVAFLTHPSHPDGWRVYQVAHFDWARQYFGSDSSWWRYDYHWSATTPSSFHTRSTIIADVVSTSDRDSLNTYGIEACYDFHGYTLRSVSRVDLGGTVGHVVDYRSGPHSEWTNVYWINPVRNSDGGIDYERVNLMLVDDAQSSFTARVPPLSAPSGLGATIEDALGGGGAPASPRLTETRAFLAAFAADLVRHQRRIDPAS